MTVIPQMLENQISLLKKCLEFYADEQNYTNNLINADKGFLAKETLKNVQNLANQNKELSDQYDILTKKNASPEEAMGEIWKIIREIDKENENENEQSTIS